MTYNDDISRNMSMSVVCSPLNCSVYSSDLEMINWNPFYVALEFLIGQSSVNYDKQYDKVNQMIIINDRHPSNCIFSLKHLQTLQLINTNLSLSSDMSNWASLTSLTIDCDNGGIGSDLRRELGRLNLLTSLPSEINR
jgi:hypothetical protein